MKRLPRPIKSDLKSRRFVWDEERAIRWPYYKILREFSTLKQFYPEIDPYAEVYRMRCTRVFPRAWMGPGTSGPL